MDHRQPERAAGVAILTDRRLCFVGAAGCTSLSMLGEELRYVPGPGEPPEARFETEEGALAFEVHGPEEQAHLGNLLGNLADLREARAKLQRMGVDYRFVSPAREGAEEGVSAIYQLMRLKELLNKGVFGEMDFALERTMMVQRFVEEGAAAISG